MLVMIVRGGIRRKQPEYSNTKYGNEGQTFRKHAHYLAGDGPAKSSGSRQAGASHLMPQPAASFRGGDALRR